MTPELIAATVSEAFDGAVVEAGMDSCHPFVRIVPERWREVARFLRDDPRLKLNMLRCVSGIDWLEDGQIEVVYDLISMRPGAAAGVWMGESAIAFRVRVPRDGGHLPTVADIWPTADWHERETADMFGVSFDGHPDPRRILCPDDWVGHPLRKDYEYPLEYHGIPGTTELGQKSPRH